MFFDLQTITSVQCVLNDTVFKWLFKKRKKICTYYWEIKISNRYKNNVTSAVQCWIPLHKELIWVFGWFRRSRRIKEIFKMSRIHILRGLSNFPNKYMNILLHFSRMWHSFWMLLVLRWLKSRLVTLLVGNVNYSTCSKIKVNIC